MTVPGARYVEAVGDAPVRAVLSPALDEYESDVVESRQVVDKGVAAVVSLAVAESREVAKGTRDAAVDRGLCGTMRYPYCRLGADGSPGVGSGDSGVRHDSPSGSAASEEARERGSYSPVPHDRANEVTSQEAPRCSEATGKSPSDGAPDDVVIGEVHEGMGSREDDAGRERAGGRDVVCRWASQDGDAGEISPS